MVSLNPFNTFSNDSVLAFVLMVRLCWSLWWNEPCLLHSTCLQEPGFLQSCQSLHEKTPKNQWNGSNQKKKYHLYLFVFMTFTLDHWTIDIMISDFPAADIPCLLHYANLVYLHVYVHWVLNLEKTKYSCFSFLITYGWPILKLRSKSKHRLLNFHQ